MKSRTMRAFKGLILCVMILVGTPAIAQAQDCAKAKDIYQSARKLLNFHDRATEFQKAIQLCPTYAEAHNDLADAYENLAKLNTHDVKKFNAYLDKAVEEYRAAIKYNSNIFESYLGLGDSFRVMGLLEQSEENYRHALQIRPGEQRASWGLEQVQTLKSEDASGPKKAADILKHFKTSSAASKVGRTMGFEKHTVVKDRVRFDKILFNEWSAEIKKQEAIQQLQEIGRALAAPELSRMEFVVEGHTDDRGAPERNMKLSWDRSESVKKYLIAHFGIDASRIKTQGFGFSRPRVPNDSPSHMELNRRVEILFMDQNAMQ